MKWLTADFHFFGTEALARLWLEHFNRIVDGTSQGGFDFLGKKYVLHFHSAKGWTFFA